MKVLAIVVMVVLAFTVGWIASRVHFFWDIL